MLYIYRLCQCGAGGARRLCSEPDSMDARLSTSPHSSVYFLNRPLFGLTSVGREYLRKRGRKSVENKGKGKKLSVIETAPHCSWLRQSFTVLGAIKISHPGRRLARQRRGRLVVTLADTKKKICRELFQCLCVLNSCFWFSETGEERCTLPTVNKHVFNSCTAYTLICFVMQCLAKVFIPISKFFGYV